MGGVRQRPTADQVIERKHSGFVVVQDNERYCWRRALRQALRDIDRMLDAWGERITIVDCETKERIYDFRMLGS